MQNTIQLGKEIKIKQYEVLTGDATHFRWVACHGPAIPEDWIPVEGGWEADGKKVSHYSYYRIGGVT